MNSETKNCQNCKKDFTIEPDDFKFYEKIQVPPPTWCPKCRLTRRLAWRNDRYLSKADCKLCGISTFSTIDKDFGCGVLCVDCWKSDKWIALDYGQDYDFSRPFLEQFKELMKKVPLGARFVSSSTILNSDYTNLVSNLKNCYLIYNSDYDENCMYGSEIESSKDCVDNTMIDGCEQSYGNVNCQKCSKIFFSTDCSDSSDLWFSYDLVGCMNCFGCVGLRNKNYYIFNQPYPRESYQEKIKEFSVSNFNNIAGIEAKVREIYLKIPRRYMHGRQNANTSGDYIYNSKEVKKSYIVTGSQNCKYCMWLIVSGVKDCWDYTEWGKQAEAIYEVITAGANVSKIKFCSAVSQNSMEVEYSYRCSNVQNIFGCVGVKKKQYCILNKQYTKEEYEQLIPKIIQHMNDMPYVDEKGRIYKYGEFLPFDISPYAYNQTTAQEFFPLEKEDIENQGFWYEDIADKNYVPTIIKGNLPDSINDVPDSIINEIIECEEWGKEKSKMHNCTKAFRITLNELNFYKQHNLPLPRKCPNCRHYDRVSRRNPITLWHRKCMKKGCSNEFETTYAPDRSEIVYCEKCYQQEVY